MCKTALIFSPKPVLSLFVPNSLEQKHHPPNYSSQITLILSLLPPYPMRHQILSLLLTLQLSNLPTSFSSYSLSPQFKPLFFSPSQTGAVATCSFHVHAFPTPVCPSVLHRSRFFKTRNIKIDSSWNKLIWGHKNKNKSKYQSLTIKLTKISMSLTSWNLLSTYNMLKL